jgi:hypothetical protein
MPWQEMVSGVAGEVDADGRFSYGLIDLVVPRQAGKTDLALATLIQRGQLRRMARGWYTAATRQDAADKFAEDWVPLIDESPIRRLVTLRKANGSERLTVNKTRSTIGLFPPTRKGLHGKQADTVFVDECWAFDVAQGSDIEQGAGPAQITRPYSQLWRISAAGDDRSSYLDAIMESGRELVESGRPSDRAYFEWSAPVDPDDNYDPYDRDLWWAAHPALGFTIQEKDLARKAELTKDPAEFARSYLCIPARGSVSRVISIDAWQAVVVASEPKPRPASIAVEISPSRTSGSIGLAGRRDDGRCQVEVVDCRPGTAWLVPRLVELHQRYGCKLVLDPSGPAGALRNDLTRAKLEFEEMAGREVGQACGSFYDGVLEGGIVHIDQAELNSALAGARKRLVGEAWAWDRKTAGIDISPLVAVTLAAWKAGVTKQEFFAY